MEDLNNPKKYDLGMQLHYAETAIHTGKLAVGALLLQEPIDQTALTEAKSELHELRLRRNKVRTELNAAKATRLLGSYSTWLV